MNITDWVKNHKPLCICTFGLAIVGYMGYRAVCWIKNKCFKTEKPDRVFQNTIGKNPSNQPSSSPNKPSFTATPAPARPSSSPAGAPSSVTANLSEQFWWTKITKSKEFTDFKQNWKKLADPNTREEEVFQLECSYLGGPQLQIPLRESEYGAFLGKIHWIPGQFSMWMPGVALVAAYIAEKKKIEGLYVCASMEALSRRINEIHLNPNDQRCALIVGATPSGLQNDYPGYFEANYPQHKLAVCVEKKDGKLSIAVLDPQGDKDLLPSHLTSELWSGDRERENFNGQELVYRAILQGCRKSNCTARLLYSQVLRETAYGCETFALQDAVAFLRNPKFFDGVGTQKEKVKVDDQYQLEVITKLPPEHLIGTQSSRHLETYRKKWGQFNKVLIGREKKKKTLQSYLNTHQVEVHHKGQRKKQNQYITKKSFKYLKFVVSALKKLSQEEIENLVNKILIT